MKLMTFNLRCNNDPNGHSIAERGFRIRDIIRDYQPDLCGFQEVVPAWLPELEVLEEYDHVLDWRGERDFEATPIYWKKSVFELVDHQKFWLSPTPEYRSKGWGGGFGIPRVCTYVALKHLESGRVVHYYNTHFDGSDVSARESAQLIIRRQEKIDRDGITFCTADFNMYPDTPGWYSMRTFFKDVREEIAPENKQGTLNIYKEVGEDLGRLIDFIFYHGKGVQAKTYEVITRLYDGKFPSDHYGIISEFELEKQE